MSTAELLDVKRQPAPAARRARTALRFALIAVITVHFPYPLAFVWALMAGVSGHSDGAAALLIAPVMFFVTAMVVGPLAWRSWRGRRVAPWVLTLFVAFEVWLWRNGTRTESWDEPGSAERLATFQLVTHSAALVLLLPSAVASLFWSSATRVRERTVS